MPTVNDLLGPKPRVTDLLGPAPLSEASQAFSVVVPPPGADDNLARAGRDFWSAQSFNEQGQLSRINNAQPPIDPNAPMVKILPELSREDLQALKEATPEEQREAGLAHGLAQNVNSLTSVNSIGLLAGTMGLGLTPTLGRIAALGFAAYMGKHAVETAGELGREYAKPAEQRDNLKIGQLAASGGSELFLAGLSGAHGVKGETPNFKLETSKLTAEAVERAAVRGAQPNVRELLGEGGGEDLRRGFGDAFAQLEQDITTAEASTTDREARRARALNEFVAKLPAPRRERVTVPETPAEPERNLTAVEEIRQKGARTRKEIQRLYAKRGLSNEEAARLRDAAWKDYTPPEEVQSPEVTADTAEELQRAMTGNQVKPEQAELPVAAAPAKSKLELQDERWAEMSSRLDEAETEEDVNRLTTEIDQAHQRDEISNAAQNALTMQAFRRSIDLKPKPAEPTEQASGTSTGPKKPKGSELPVETTAARTASFSSGSSPWQQTKSEYVRAQIGEPSAGSPAEQQRWDRSRLRLLGQHERAVKRAVRQRQAVPEAVMKEYGLKVRADTPKPRTGAKRSESGRPWDLIDEIEARHGGIDPRLIEEADPGWRPIGAARKIIRQGGRGADTILQALVDENAIRVDPTKLAEFGEEINAAALARRGWRERLSKENKLLAEEAGQAEAFSRDRKRESHAHEPLVPEELLPGDEFTLRGTKVTVKEFSFDEDGEVTGVVLEDGEKYGTQRLPAGEKINADENSLTRAPGDAGDEWTKGKTPPPSSQDPVENAAPGATGEAVLREEPAKPGETRNPGRIEGMGGSSAASPGARQQAATARALRTQQQAPLQPAGQQLQQAQAAATTPRGKWFLGLRRIFAPQTIDEHASHMAGIIRHALGQEYEAQRQADFALREFRREFDRTPVGRNWTYQPPPAGQPKGWTPNLPRNYEVMRAIDSGDVQNLTPLEAQFARTMRRLLDEAIDDVHQVSPDSLRELLENYFPRIWREPEANAALINKLMSKRPWEGPKSFLKKRVLAYFTDGLELGLRPISDNPVDVTLQKLGEMHRFVATRRAMAEAKAAGLRKFVYVYEKAPEGWRTVEDPSSNVFKPPTVTVKEAFDEQMRVKTLEFMERMGIAYERTSNIRGTRRWGEAQERPPIIRAKFGGAEFINWHELGHHMDYRYPDLRRMTMYGSREIQNQARALADLREEGKPSVSAGRKQYLHKAEEKMANLFHAYLHAPEKFKRVAPLVWDGLNKWLDLHPDVKGPLNEIRPGLKLGEGSTEVFVGGPVLLGRWMMPEGVAQVVNNYLQPGLGKFKAFRTLREISGLQNGVQLAGFFHGQFVLNDSFYSGIGLALHDVLTGHPVRAAGEVLQIPISPITSLVRGHRIKAAIENPAGASAQYRQLGKLAVEQNLRAGHGNFDPEFGRRWKRAFNEALHEPSVGATWEAFWRAPLGALDLAMTPVMRALVPRMKLGIYARMAERVIADYPNADRVELRRRLAEAADATEDRLGQVTYDNLFQSRVMKDAGQLAFRAYGWQLTKYRMILGGAGDWARAAASLVQGEKPNVTFRMTYLPAMVMGHAVLGGLLHYALTGKRPEKLQDYLFPETGLVDAYGRRVRVAIADFVKDVVADVRSVPNLKKMGEEWSRKLAPMWAMAAEMYRNTDFWGTRIFSEKQLGEPALEHLLANLKEGATYMAKNALPFSVTAGQRVKDVGGSKLMQFGPWFGLVPAPRYALQTPAEARASEIMREMMPSGARSADQSAHSQAIGDLIRDIRTGKVNNEGQFEARERAAGVKNKAEETRIKERVLWTPMQYQVNKMPVEKAMQVFDLTRPEERLSLAPFLAEKVQRAWESKRLNDAEAQRYVKLVLPWYQKAKALKAQPRPAAAPAQNAFAR